ncbi:hypothetical protein SAMN02745671_02545 [Anaerovibrio lipolyticus DSM 3074]|uniref:Uncharacterized protein n=1 Tax=Anaerovibrio lipolyticus DSM 3074 TaxID=1120997 RepID=A0A1M6G6W7_9FIRM|nr:hypothetical protein [Anaerovibrio lipolyticus]SHJ05711.1 hypothetical protein SAMN02745671_02545 [Anaerovibrio lipolyticus DSM 3074]
MNKTEQFFNMLNKNPNENIYQLNNEFKQLNTSIQKAVENPQQNIYYAVNDFPIVNNGYILRQADKVRRFNACYVDIDLKNDQGEHLQDKDLQKNKQNIYNKLIGLSCPPSAIVESKNGYHTYWIITKADRQDCIPMRWRRLEQCIYNYIYNNISNGADSKATDATRILRCPNSYHVKADNTSPFLVQVKYLSRPYTLLELEEHFPAIHNNEPQEKKTTKQDKPQEVRALEPACSDIYTAINELDSDYFDYITPINAELGWQDAEKTLKSQDIRTFLGLNVNLKQSFSSVLRKDDNPSCTIYCNQGVYLYCDFGLNYTADIIRLVSTVAGVKYSKAVKWLCSVYGIELLDTFKNGRTDIEPLINENITTITKTAKEAEARGIFFISSVIELYKVIMEIWKKQVTEKGFQNPSDCNILLGSQYLADKTGKDRKTIRRQLLILQAIGALKRIASKSNISKYGNKTNTYIVQELDANTILQKARDLLEFCPSPLSKLTEKQFNLFSYSDYWGSNLDI